MTCSKCSDGPHTTPCPLLHSTSVACHAAHLIDNCLAEKSIMKQPIPQFTLPGTDTFSLRGELAVCEPPAEKDREEWKDTETKNLFENEPIQDKP